MPDPINQFKKKSFTLKPQQYKTEKESTSMNKVIKNEKEVINTIKDSSEIKETGYLKNPRSAMYKQREKFSNKNTETFFKDMKKELDGEVDFIIKKSVVENKVFEEEKSNYFPSTIDNHFYHEKNITNGENQYIESILKNYYKENPTEIRNKIL